MHLCTVWFAHRPLLQKIFLECQSGRHVAGAMETLWGNGSDILPRGAGEENGRGMTRGWPMPLPPHESVLRKPERHMLGPK